MNLSETAFLNITLKEFLEQGGRVPEALIDPDLSIQDALALIQREKKEFLLVGASGSEKVGIFSETELVSAVLQDKEKLGDIVAIDQKAMAIDQTLRDCLGFFHSFAKRSFFVHNQETHQSYVLTVRDFLFLLAKHFKEELESYRLVLPGDPSFTIQLEREVSRPQNDTNANLFLVPLGRLIKPNPLKLKSSTSIFDCLVEMNRTGADLAIVVEYETQLEGIFTERDFLKLMMKNPELKSHDLKDISLESVMTRSPHSFTIRHNMAQALRNMSHFGYRQVVVSDDEKIPVGIVSILSILSFISRYI